MDKSSALYQLMDIRVNDILDEILKNDEEYQQISQKSGEYLERLDAMALPQVVWSLINWHASEQNALGARYGALAYMLGFSDCTLFQEIKIVYNFIKIPRINMAIALLFYGEGLLYS